MFAWATGDVSRLVSNPATTTFVSTMTGGRLTVCGALVGFELAAPSCPPHQAVCVVSRLDAVEVQTFIDQLPDGLGALGRCFLGLGSVTRTG